MKYILILNTIFIVNFANAAGFIAVGLYDCKNIGTSWYSNNDIVITIDGDFNLFFNNQEVAYDKKDSFGWMTGMRTSTTGFNKDQVTSKLNYRQKTFVNSNKLIRMLSTSSIDSKTRSSDDADFYKFEWISNGKYKLTKTNLLIDQINEFECTKKVGKD